MLYTLLLSGLLSLGVSAPADSLRFTPFEVDAGLSQSSVYALAQDSLGFLWAGTHDGLDRFDGVEFVSHRVPQGGVRDNRIQALAADGARLWVLSHGGLHLRDLRRGGVQPILRHPFMAGLSLHRGGGVWAGVRDSVVLADAGGLRSARRMPATVRSLHEDAHGRLWVGTTDGLYALVEGNLHGPWRRGQQIHALAEPSPGVIWVGASRSAFQIAARGRIDVLLDQGVRAFAVAEGQGWAATLEGHLFALDPASAPREIALPFARTIAALLYDRSGMLWIGTDGGGLIRADATPRPARVLLPGPPLSASNFITSLAETPDGRIWVGSPARGAHVIEPDGRVVEVPGPFGPDDPVLRVHADGAGRLWTGTPSGVAVREGARFVPVEMPWVDGGPRPARAFAEDGAGGFWIAAGRGFYYRPPGGAFVDRTRETGGWSTVVAMHRGASGSLWAVNVCAGILWLGGDGRIERLHDPGECHLRANAVVEDGPGQLWVATSGGLYTFDLARDTLQPHPLPLPLAKRHPYLYSLLRDAAGRLWMGTNGGLIRYDPVQGVARRFTRADGLPSEEFNAGAALQTRDGRLVFGTVNGLALFGADHLGVPGSGPAVTFTALTRFDEPVTGEPDINLRERLVLRPGQTVFSLRFAALGLPDPLRARYRYRMDVLDSTWVEAGVGREARYTNLPTGPHTFLVQAAGAEGVWGPVRRLEILVVPPLWQRPWFVALSGLLALAGLFLAVRHFTSRRLRRRLRALEMEQRVARELEQERARIAADVHDQVGATLTQIKLLSEVARARAGGPPATLQQIRQAAQSAVEELDAIVWALDAAHDGLEHFSDYLCAQAETLCAQADVALRLDLPPAWPERRLPATVRHPVFLAVREALCNSVRHAAARTIHLRFSADAAHVSIEVADDGTGFDPEAVGRFCNGLDNMRRRLESVGGACVVTTAAGAGTRVRFDVPLHVPRFASLGNGLS